METDGIMQIYKNSSLMVTFIAHFIFTTWGCQGYWTPNSYVFYNAFFLGTLIVAITLKNDKSIVGVCLAINALAVVFDVIALAVYFPSGVSGSADRFSAGMAIINLLIRPISCYGIFQTLKRGVDEDPDGVPGYEGI